MYAPAANEPTGGDVYGAWKLPDGELARADRRRRRQGRRDRRAERDGALLRRGAQLGRALAGAGARAGQPDALRAPAARHLRDRLPRRAARGRDALRATPATCRRCCSAGGEARELVGHGLPLGVDQDAATTRPSCGSTKGDLVLAYTDGLVEARRGGELYGSERLARLAAGWAATLGPDALVRAVHEEIAGWAEGLTDDAVALALRRRTRSDRPVSSRAPASEDAARRSPPAADPLEWRPWRGAYARAGVDQHQSGSAVAALVGVLAAIDTGRPSRAALRSGHYANVLRISRARRASRSSSDGVGTKLIVAEQLDRLDTVGIDCIAMNVNDVICVGAEPIARARLHRRRGGRPRRGWSRSRVGLRTRRRAGRRRDPRRRAGGAARADPRPPLAARLRPGRHLRRPGRPRRDRHRRARRARRRADRPALERRPLERLHARPRGAARPRRGARRRSAAPASARRCSSRP